MQKTAINVKNYQNCVRLMGISVDGTHCSLAHIQKKNFYIRHKYDTCVMQIKYMNEKWHDANDDKRNTLTIWLFFRFFGYPQIYVR